MARDGVVVSRGWDDARSADGLQSPLDPPVALHYEAGYDRNVPVYRITLVASRRGQRLSMLSLRVRATNARSSSETIRGGASVTTLLKPATVSPFLPTMRPRSLQPAMTRPTLEPTSVPEPPTCPLRVRSPTFAAAREHFGNRLHRPCLPALCSRPSPGVHPG